MIISLLIASRAGYWSKVNRTRIGGSRSSPLFPCEISLTISISSHRNSAQKKETDLRFQKTRTPRAQSYCRSGQPLQFRPLDQCDTRVQDYKVVHDRRVVFILSVRVYWNGAVVVSTCFVICCVNNLHSWHEGYPSSDLFTAGTRVKLIKFLLFWGTSVRTNTYCRKLTSDDPLSLPKIKIRLPVWIAEFEGEVLRFTRMIIEDLLWQTDTLDMSTGILGESVSVHEVCYLLENWTSDWNV